MEKLTIGVIKNKIFIKGFITGLIIAAAVAILLVSLNQPTPGKQMVKGTLLSWSPSVGDKGTIKWTGDTDSCGRYVGVKFYNDPSGSLIICRPDGSTLSGSEVMVNRIADGQPCGNPPGGVWVSPSKSGKIQIPK
ncbi:MAG: hypothetical protein WCO93_05290 [bacterium]